MPKHVLGLLRCTALASVTVALGALPARAEAPRITGAVNDTAPAVLSHTHVALPANLVAKATAVPPALHMEHLQLVLTPSPDRRAAAKALIASLHTPGDPQFRHWLTPEQFGKAYGVEDADIATVTRWLGSKGLTVNGTTPGRTLIDFSGTVAQVQAAFHTQETMVKLGSETQMVNTGDIAVPAAMKEVVAGVMGLSSFHAKPLYTAPVHATYDAATQTFHKDAGAHPDAVIFNGGAERGLVPGDFRTIYGANELIKSGITGAGITIALVEDGEMLRSEQAAFKRVFGLEQYGGTFSQINPKPANGKNNCFPAKLSVYGESIETVLDAQYSAGIAPGANIVVAACADYTPQGGPATDNFFGGVFIAATNEINAASGRPDVISASYGYGEAFTDAASKTAIDAMWQQADAEGISVFVSTGDSGSNPSFNGGIISSVPTVDANSFATSTSVTGVGGTDYSDIYDKLSGYFTGKNDLVNGTATSYVPEIPWNESCGNAVVGASIGYPTAEKFCLAQLKFDPNGYYVTSEAGSGGPSSVDKKPDWQSLVYGAVNDTSRDLPDVSLFAGSYNFNTGAIICVSFAPCDKKFTNGVILEGGTSLSSPMFAGIQALVDQSFVKAGKAPDQGNAAPTLYAIAAGEYGSATKPSKAGLDNCNGSLGRAEASTCVFNNVQRGSIVTNCFYTIGDSSSPVVTPGCSGYGTIFGIDVIGLTTTAIGQTDPDFNSGDAAYSAKRGWSFANGLGSVNATNLAAAWMTYAQ